MNIVKAIPHPWVRGEERKVYEFPVTRKIVIEADATLSEDEVLTLAKRCQDKELSLSITSGQYRVTLSKE